MPILIVVDDLIFLSKIRQTAKLVNVAIENVQPGQLNERLATAPAAAVICDLNYKGGLALDAVRELKDNPRLQSIRVIGFLSHVQSELASSARAAGCDAVMARSAFSAQLPRLLREFDGGDAGPVSSASLNHAS